MRRQALHYATDRRVQAAALVAAVAVVGRFFDPSLQIVTYAGFLAGVLNGPRTGEWEFTGPYASIPAAAGALVLSAVLFAGIPLGYYTFPIDFALQSGLDVLGPLFELLVFTPLYAVEAAVAFYLVKRVPGVTPATP